ncbi:MAG: hypothetical protein VB858_18885, partial [Planctomycetaceae bacterium]
MRLLPDRWTEAFFKGGYRSSVAYSPQLARQLLQTGLLAGCLCGCGDGDPAPRSEPAKAQTGVRRSIPADTGEHTASQSDRPQAANPAAPEHLPADPAPVAEQPQVFRPAYSRTEQDPQQLATFGLSRFSTEHLELITDLPPEQSLPLVPLVDALQPFLEDYFGSLPPARDGSDYRISGFVMADRDRFIRAGLAKADLLDTFHGRQIGAEFWMNNQTLGYYRRHLLLHEAVHCYMRHLPGETGFPMWYMEGMAEMIATHRRSADDSESLTDRTDGEFTFNVMPASRMRFRGLERIIILQRDAKKNGVRSMTRIRSMTGNDFKNAVESYAWCWALCRFLDSHPTTQTDFR